MPKRPHTWKGIKFHSYHCYLIIENFMT